MYIFPAYSFGIGNDLKYFCNECCQTGISAHKNTLTCPKCGQKAGIRKTLPKPAPWKGCGEFYSFRKEWGQDSCQYITIREQEPNDEATSIMIPLDHLQAIVNFYKK